MVEILSQPLSTIFVICNSSSSSLSQGVSGDQILRAASFSFCELSPSRMISLVGNDGIWSLMERKRAPKINYDTRGYLGFRMISNHGILHFFSYLKLLVNSYVK